jgi:hypothetical protein
MGWKLESLAGFTLERIIADSIQKQYAIVRTGRIRNPQGGAPAMEVNGKFIPVADIQMWGARKGWLEIKCKSEPEYFSKYGRSEHGINEESYNRYKETIKLTEQPLYLLFCESCSGQMLMADLDTLDINGAPRRGRINGREDSALMINWRRSALIPVGKMLFPENDLFKVEIKLENEALNSFLRQCRLPFPLDVERRTYAKQAGV